MQIEEFVKILICPVSKESLNLASEQLLLEINRQICAGKIKNRKGQVVSSELESALINNSLNLAYPLISGIPVLLPEEALEITLSGY